MLSTDELRSLKSRAVRMANKDGEYDLNSPAFMYWLVRLAIDDEREACAKVCEDEIARVKPLYSVVAENCVKAIRARGQA